MSIFKNTTSPSKVAGSSQWFPQEKGDTAKMWKSSGGMKMDKMPKEKKSKGSM